MVGKSIQYVEQVLTSLDKSPELTIGIIGDFFLDKYLVIDPALNEISLETGKIAHQVVEIYHSPGAAGTVTSNLSGLEVGRILAIGAIGDDGQGYELMQGLLERNIDATYLIQSKKIFTPTYTKPLRLEAGKRIEQERIDIKNRHSIPLQIETAILTNLEKIIEEVDGLIIADQVEERNFGIITDNVRNKLIELGQKYPQKVIFADSRARIGLFKNMYIKPNKFEAYRAIYGQNKKGEITMNEAGHYGMQLSRKTNRSVIVTLEKDGAMVCKKSKTTHISGIPVAGEIDPVGAGDSFSAGFTVAKCATASDEAAAFMGIVIASITIQKIGTTGTASPEEVKMRLAEISP